LDEVSKLVINYLKNSFHILKWQVLLFETFYFKIAKLNTSLAIIKLVHIETSINIFRVSL